MFKSRLTSLHPEIQARDWGVILGISVLPPAFRYYVPLILSVTVAAVRSPVQFVCCAMARGQECEWGWEPGLVSVPGNCLECEKGWTFFSQSGSFASCVAQRRSFPLIPLSTEDDLVTFSNWYKGFLKFSSRLSAGLVQQLHPNCSLYYFFLPIHPHMQSVRMVYIKLKTDHGVLCLKSFFCTSLPSGKKSNLLWKHIRWFLLWLHLLCYQSSILYPAVESCAYLLSHSMLLAFASVPVMDWCLYPPCSPKFIYWSHNPFSPQCDIIRMQGFREIIGLDEVMSAELLWWD